MLHHGNSEFLLVRRVRWNALLCWLVRVQCSVDTWVVVVSRCPELRIRAAPLKYGHEMRD
jgi:hypothetical protein